MGLVELEPLVETVGDVVTVSLGDAVGELERDKVGVAEPERDGVGLVELEPLVETVGDAVVDIVAFADVEADGVGTPSP